MLKHQAETTHHVTCQEYEHLCVEINRHNRLYFEEAQPEISDEEYDRLLRRLEEIEMRHPDWIIPTSPTQRIGEKPLEGFQDVVHAQPMLSLEKAFTREEIEAFHQRVCKLLERKEVSYCVELKMDGLAMSVTYEKGHYTRAITRGDGRVGSDVTRNLKVLRNLPLTLLITQVPDHLELRGEVFIPLKAFEEMNKDREQEGLPLWANPRNAAAGSIKLLDPREVAKRAQLSVVFYNLAHGWEKTIKSQYQIHKTLREWGLPTLQSLIDRTCPGLKIGNTNEIVQKVNSVDEIMRYAQAIEHIRNDLPFEIDGIVIKVDNLEDQELLGSTVKHPRSAIAYKFTAQKAWTTIKQITLQVGRTGAITPVAELAPTLLAGSTISRATLHNEGEVRRKDIRVGDTVCIEKGGDVIPKVVEVDVSKRTETSQEWQMIKHCPSCGSELIKDGDEAVWRCPNAQGCPDQVLRRLIHFAGKEALDIEHLGEKVMQQLFSKGFVNQGSDVFHLTAEQLYQLEGFKEKSVKNLLESIEKSKDVTLPRFIMALSIRYVGIGTAESLAEYAKNMPTLMSMSEEQLLRCEGIGSTVARAVIEYFSSQANREEVQQLLHILRIKTVDHSNFVNHPFYNKTVVLTGSLQSLSRQQAAERIKGVGGRVSESVGKKTDYVVCGESPGSKFEKAKALGISILSEEEFLKTLADNQES